MKHPQNDQISSNSLILRNLFTVFMVGNYAITSKKDISFGLCSHFHFLYHGLGGGGRIMLSPFISVHICYPVYPLDDCWCDFCNCATLGCWLEVVDQPQNKHVLKPQVVGPFALMKISSENLPVGGTQNRPKSKIFAAKFCT